VVTYCGKLENTRGRPHILARPLVFTGTLDSAPKKIGFVSAPQQGVDGATRDASRMPQDLDEQNWPLIDQVLQPAALAVERKSGSGTPNLDVKAV
jgi:hypothetical protein